MFVKSLIQILVLAVPGLGEYESDMRAYCSRAARPSIRQY